MVTQCSGVSGGATTRLSSLQGTAPPEDPGNVVQTGLRFFLREQLGSSDRILECVEQTMHIRPEGRRLAVAGQGTAFEEVGAGLADDVESEGLEVAARELAGQRRHGPWFGETSGEALI
jgi:hypothetical protein